MSTIHSNAFLHSSPIVLLLVQSTNLAHNINFVFYHNWVEAIYKFETDDDKLMSLKITIYITSWIIFKHFHCQVILENFWEMLLIVLPDYIGVNL